MKRSVLALMALMVVSICGMAQTEATWPESSRETKPGSRWWWMGSAVDEANLRRLIQEYANAGIGTLEITPIYGVQGNEKNEKAYLSEQWMKMLGVCQQEGEAQGIDIDMNGGTGWPFGGPSVTLSEAAAKLEHDTQVLTSDGQTPLTMRLTANSQKTLSRVMAFPQTGTDGQVTDITAMAQGNTLTWTAPTGQWRLIAVYCGRTLQQVKRAAPGGEGYVLDHYDSTAVANYLKRFDERFAQYGAQWPHSFFNDSYEVYGADWTPRMFEQFERLRGYRLEDHIDQLLGYATDASAQVLADYRQTLSDLLLENFTRQWTRWAHSHGVTTRNQAHGSPGNLLDFYATVDIPEIESFGISPLPISGLRQDLGFTSENLSDLSTLKYASSAAHVTGKRLTSSETFTWLTEHFRTSLSQMKPDMDLMFLAGVNHIFFHGTTYSPEEAAWPGWKFYASIDMSPTNSIWHDAPSMMAYADRCQRFLQMGQPDNDVLVYAPFHYAMHQTTGANSARLQLFDINTLSQKVPSVVTVMKYLQAAGLDADFVSDRQLLATTCNADGRLTTEGGTVYRALLVPEKQYMPADVQKHLDELQAAGATIVYSKKASGIKSLGVEGEPMATELGLRYLRRRNDTGHHYFIANLSATDVAAYTALRVPLQQAVFFDPLTGSIRQAETDDEGRVWLALKSGQSIILQTYDTPVATEQTDVPVVEMAGIAVDGPWTLSFSPALGTTTYPLDHLQTWETLDQQTAQFMGTGVYETALNVSRELLDMAGGGLLLRLGDVRESARVYINEVYAGCAWSVPFELDVTGLLHEGDNRLRIEVTNLPANRISQMDRDGIVWRIFKDVNILDVVNGSTSQSGITYESWQLMPSGLNSRVEIVPLRRRQTELQATLERFVCEADAYYPVYRVSTADGQPVSHLRLTTTDGQTIEDFEVVDESHVVLRASATGYVVLHGQDASGTGYSAWLTAPGAYDLLRLVDFTSANPPLCGWMAMPSAHAMTGFSGTGALPWYRAEVNGKELTTLYEGLMFACDVANYYFFYPGYGMTANADFAIGMTANEGDACIVSYMQGEGTTVYNAADSLTVSARCLDNSLSIPLRKQDDGVVYRTLALYRPRHQQLSVAQSTLLTPRADVWYTLQGVRVSRPQRGIYIRNGRKVITK